MANHKFVMPVYFKDLNETTKGWTDEEFGAYVRLLMHQWSQGFIPNDIRRITLIAESAQKNWDILGKKFPAAETGLQNQRLEEIRAEQKSFSKKQSDNGKKGGRPKNKKPKETQTISQPETQTKTLLRSNKLRSRSRSNLSSNTMLDNKLELVSEFEQIWELYQKKRGDKKKIFKKWEQLTVDDKKKIFEHVPLYVNSTPDKKYRKDFDTYLNNSCWNDEIIQPDGGTTNKKSDTVPDRYRAGDQDYSKTEF